MSVRSNILVWWNDFVNLFYPNLCQACGNYLFKNEIAICTRCLYDLPKTDFYLQKNNPVSMLFWGRVKIEYAASYFTYAKGSKFQKLIHKLKYHNQQGIGIELGKHLGAQLKKSDFFKDIDLIVPVPLHAEKQKMRGYNQAEVVAKGISYSLDLPIELNNLYRTVHTQSQTRKSKLERWQNVDSIFKIKNTSQFTDKHILLVDDVVTTGSTIEACAHAILQAENSRVSIATLAYA